MKIVNQHFINGRFTDSHGQETVDVHNPATGELIGRSTYGDAVDAERAIAAAKADFPSWSTISLDKRKEYLQRIADALAERMDALVAMTVAEYGAPAFFSGYIDGQARDFFLLAQDLLKPENFAETNGNATITKVPVGVAGLLTPWNGNPWFVCAKAASALAAGCQDEARPRCEGEVCRSFLTRKWPRR